MLAVIASEIDLTTARSAVVAGGQEDEGDDRYYEDDDGSGIKECALAVLFLACGFFPLRGTWGGSFRCLGAMATFRFKLALLRPAEGTGTGLERGKARRACFHLRG